MKTSSCKNKGRRLQQWVGRKIAEITGLKFGQDEVIASREMGQGNTDIRLIGIAQEKFSFSIECKNQETWSLPAWIKQAKANKKEGTDWLLFIKKNRHEEIVVMDAEAFFDLYEQYLYLVFGKDHKDKN